MENFPGNSRTTRVETKRVERVEKTTEEKPKKVERIEGVTATRRKKTLGKRFSETFLGGDARGVGHFVVMDVLLPAAKDMIADAVSQGVERMIFGEGRATGRRGGGYRAAAQNAGHVAYNRFSSGSTSIRRDPREDPRPQISRQARRTHDFDEIVLDTRAQATEVLDQMYEALSKYDQVSVADLYELVGITGDYTDEKWGWENLHHSGVQRTRHGYILNLPKPEPLA